MTLEAVQPGETRRMQFSIPVEELRFYDVISQSLMVEEGCYIIGAGTSSVNILIKTINEQIQNIAQKKDTLCRRMYN